MQPQDPPTALTPRSPQGLARYGSWALVTGASDGIGREMAVSLAKAGLHLVLVARRQSLLQHVADDLSERHDIQTRILDMDLSLNGSVRTLVNETNDLDIGLLVACAGFGTSGPFIESDIEQELNMLDLNCRAVLELSHAFGQRFADQKRGGIVLMSSIVAFQGVPHAAHYAATKAYVQSLAEGLRMELTPCGVDVIASAPGPVHSGFAARADMQMGLALEPEDVAQATLNALGRRTTVRPGWLTKLLSASLATLPRWARVHIMRLVMQGMTQHQGDASKSKNRKPARSVYPGSAVDH